MMFNQDVQASAPPSGLISDLNAPFVTLVDQSLDLLSPHIIRFLFEKHLGTAALSTNRNYNDQNMQMYFGPPSSETPRFRFKRPLEVSVYPSAQPADDEGETIEQIKKELSPIDPGDVSESQANVTPFSGSMPIPAMSKRARKKAKKGIMPPPSASITPRPSLLVNPPGQAQSQGTILWLSFENMPFPETADNIYREMSTFGTVLRIMVFSNFGVVQAFVQFADSVTATKAFNAWNGHLVYNQYKIHVRFSTRQTLHIEHNDVYSRDYTNVNLPWGGDRLKLHNF